MYFKRATVAVVFAVVLLVGVGAGTASATSGSPAPTVTFQKHDMTLWYSKSDVRSAHSMYGVTMAAEFATVACGFLPHWAAKASCGVVVLSASYWIGNTFAEAADANQCVWITVEYWGDLGGWGRYRC